MKEKSTICNIYLPNQKNFNTRDMEHIIQQLPTPFILLGNFNAHNPIWGSTKTDPRGKEIEKLLDKDNIALLNDSTPSHINLANGNFSCIDLAFCSSSLAHRIEWKVLPDIFSSDHFPIKITFTPRTANHIKTKVKDGTLKTQTGHFSVKWSMMKSPNYPPLTK